MGDMGKKSGGPAFPCDGIDFENGIGGLSKRQYYAAKAMQGELSAQDGSADGFGMYSNTDENRKLLVKKAFDIADAMIAFEKEENA